MTLEQALAFVILIGMMGLFVWGRLRYDLVALLTLLAAVAVGIVAPEDAFTGFSDEIVVIVASALIVSAAVARSGIAESLLRPLAPHLTSVGRQVVVLAAAVAALSAFVKNVGALAILMPVAMQLARRTGTSPACLLMPLAFGSLLGGLTTLIGTSPNIIVSRMRADLVGQPFEMFDFAPVGAGLAVAGVIFLSFGYRLLPARRAAAPIDAAFAIEGYTTEARLPPDSPVAGRTVADLEALGEGEVEVATIIREQYRRYQPAPHWVLYGDDLMILKGEPASLERLVRRGKLALSSAEGGALAEPAAEEVGTMEAVVTAESPLVDHSAAQVGLRERHGVDLLALSRSGERVEQRLRSIRFRAGDVLVLQGNVEFLPDVLGELRCLPLAARDVPLGRDRRRVVPLAVLGLTIALVSLDLVPLAVGFFAAAVALMLLRVLSLREAYEAVEWPIVILLGALIPVSEAVRATGGTDLIAVGLAQAAAGLPALGAVAITMLAAMALTPFLNNAATVLVMAPVAASLAARLGLSPDPFLMAVAVGAACDFLTPIGHQCNTLVMGPGGYRFGDYWRLGLPLSIMVLVIGVALIALAWPLRAG